MMALGSTRMALAICTAAVNFVLSSSAFALSAAAGSAGLSVFSGSFSPSVLPAGSIFAIGSATSSLSSTSLGMAATLIFCPTLSKRFRISGKDIFIWESVAKRCELVR